MILMWSIEDATFIEEFSMTMNKNCSQKLERVMISISKLFLLYIAYTCNYIISIQLLCT